jgi:WD40 repeat protein
MPLAVGRRWDLDAGTSELLHPAPCGPMDASADGRRILVACNSAAGAEKANGVPSLTAELLVFDTSTGEHRRIESHGADIVSVAMSPSGDVIATGDSSGTVRVGRSDGREPHLLVGAGGIGSAAFSPDGHWIASGQGNEIRLWPMPDVSKPPLHTLSRDALLAKLGSLTNLRVVEDPASATDYRLDIAPFPGWKDLPTW